MPKPFYYWETGGKEQGRVMSGKSGATSTNKVIQEDEGTGRVGRYEDKTKGVALLCRRPQGRRLVALPR